MADVLKFPNHACKEEEAGQWLARIDRGLRAEEESELRVWLAADSANREVFVALAELWDEADVLAELADLFPLDRVTVVRRGRGTPRLAWACAAGVVTLIAVSGLAAYHALAPSAAPTEAQQDLVASYMTDVGEQATESLSDGSVLRLNTNTFVDVEFSVDQRIVHLRRGEAYFEVAHDADRPFHVHAGEGVVQALGTAFNVRLDSDGDVEVTVTSGRVRVGPSGEQPRDPVNRGRPAVSERAVFEGTLAEGEFAIFEHGASNGETELRILRFEPMDLDIKLAWQRGMLIFRGEPLETMLAEAGRYTTTEFIIADRKIADVRVGGYFRAGDVDGLLTALRENFQIEAERVSSDRIVLRSSR